MKKKGNLFVICGPSGVGKGTVCKELLKRRPDIKLSISATTRKKRNGELEGVNYYFISKENFQDMINKDEFWEYAEVYGNLYGTPKKYVLEHINNGEDVLLEIDIQGALQIKEKYPEGVFIFILPPSMKELRNRIVNRGTDSKESIEKRLKAAFREIDFIDKYDYYIINDKLENSISKLISIIEAEKCRVKDDIYKLIQKYKEEAK
ncbi:guanylate kinase [Caminicella sporogenes DSM 14501]|uniref:Guanylate kinase n=1 Tax=Caminicella sporogenes DSM 14501 TaxID=1121266 RepID=A0A1M6LIE8_9FIRM|nr:guanylate kinase [Caminicella sporogenes]RKD27841.1 guanylate kinase [Caminicella sporogenes]WIF94578.1 guanylate kinase [Caminicella sporogenes]SHJ70967.1 guanylate kinase [Caminicella sporogenes DSM 14501]